MTSARIKSKILCADPRAQYFSHRKDIQRAVGSVLRSGRYILGGECEGFENEFSAYAGARYGAGVASGTDAICIALKALGIGVGDEVITVSHTASATVAAIMMSGATPVFADIDPASFCIDPAAIPALISKRTKAIVAVHLYGQPADLGALSSWAKKFGIFLIEDCAQAHGALYRGKKVGSWGDVGCFSFYPTKNLGGIGDGGMIVTSDRTVYTRCLLLRQYGWDKARSSRVLGCNSRLDEIQAAILRVKLKTLDADNRKRRAVAGAYQRDCGSLPITLPSDAPGTVPVYHQYVIRLKQRNALQQHLSRCGVQALIHYPVPAHRQPAYRRYFKKALSRTEEAVGQILSLPIHPELTRLAHSKVTEALNSFFKK